MPNMPDKRLLVAVCSFLYQKRLYEPGVLEPFSVPLKDFREVFNKPEDQGLVAVDFAKLAKIFQHLAGGKNSQRQSLLEIQNPEILNGLANHCRNNEAIILVYDKEDIRWYLDRLDEGLREMQAGAGYNRLVFNLARRQFQYKGKVKQLKKNERTQSIRLNVCLLLYGHPLTYLDGHGQPVTIRSDITCEDYVPGQHVHFDVIKTLILDRGDMRTPGITRLSASQYKKITDALNGINKDVDSRWGLKVFKHEDQEAWLLHP